MNLDGAPQDILDLDREWPLGRRLNLPADSTIVVAGAYKGKASELLLRLWHPKRLVGFEPADWAYFLAKSRLETWRAVELHRFGIGKHLGVFPMGEYGTDGCSFVNVGPGSREQGEGLMIPIETAFAHLGLDVVDLFLMNLEGGEYDIVPHMIETGVILKVRGLAIQFHKGFANYSENAELEMFANLMATHRVEFDNYPRWMYWRAK